MKELYKQLKQVENFSVDEITTKDFLIGGINV